MGISSLTAGISGLKTSQFALGVIGNNLANLNTSGFKASRVTFADEFSQTLQTAQGPTSSFGGKNPIQVGSGVGIGSIDTNYTQGNISNTGRPFDLAIQGGGFFVLRTEDGSQEFYTRVGAFILDKNNDLVDSNTGLKVQGTSGTITIDVNEKQSAVATQNVTLSGNLDSATEQGATARTLISTTAFTTAAGTVSTGDALNLLSLNSTNYTVGDSITITGKETNGVAVSATFNWGDSGVTGQDGTTMGDLMSFISTNYGTATASINTDSSDSIADGTLVLTSDISGQSSLSLIVADGSGNTGATTWPTVSTSPTGSVTGSGETFTTTFSVFDDLGATVSVSLNFYKSGTNAWSITPYSKAENGALSLNFDTLNFSSTGALSNATLSGSTVSSTTLTIGSNIPLNLSISDLSQFSGANSAAAIDVDGHTAGFYSSTSISADGTITTLFTNGQTSDTTSQITLATFSNPAGLSKRGDNRYAVTVASGEPVFRQPLSGVAGSLVTGALESSNVDIAEEFTNLIISQRAFQANARTITTTDEVLQELVNIVR